MKRKPFECPYDLESCDYVDPTIATLDKNCNECERYNHGIIPNRGCYPSLRLAILCIIGIIITILLWNCQSAYEPWIPRYELKVDATDSGLYFNYYLMTDTLGRPSRKYGPVKEYKYEKYNPTTTYFDTTIVSFGMRY